MRDQNQQFLEQIKKSQNILITFGNSSTDSLSSALACALFLTGLGKKADIYADAQMIDNKLNFLPGFDQIYSSLQDIKSLVVSLNLSQAKIGDVFHYIDNNKLNLVISPINGAITKDDIVLSEDKYKYDLIITIGTHDLMSLGDTFNNNTDFFYKTPIINIDYSSANEHYGQINIIDLNAISSGEVLFSLIEDTDKLAITKEIATDLLASIIISTNSFKTKNISPTTLATTAALVEFGGDRELIVNKLYRSRNINVLKLWGVALARLKSDNDSQVIYSEITHEDFVKTKTTNLDLADVVEELIVNIPTAKAIVIFYEVASDFARSTEALVHGVKNLDVEQLLKEFNPSGTKANITIHSNDSIMDFEKRLINSLEEKISRLV